MKKIIGIILLSLVLSQFLAFASSLAISKGDIMEQVQKGGGPSGFVNAKPPQQFIAEIIQIILTTVGIIFIALMVYGGYELITAGGEEEKAKKGLDTIRTALIGLIIILAAYGITMFVAGKFQEAATTPPLTPLSFLLAGPVLAADYRGAAMGQLEAAAGKEGAAYGQAVDPRAVAAYTVQILMGTLGMIFLAYLVYAGYIILFSGGNEEKVSKGRRMIFQAVLGVFISLSAFSIALFADRYFRDAAGSAVPDTYSVTGFEIEKDTSQFFNTDPLEKDSYIGPEFGGWQEKTW